VVVEPVDLVQSTKQQNRLMELETLKSKAVKLKNRKTELLKANNPKDADVQRVVAKISRIEKQIKRVEDKIHKKQE
jgi:predicted nuclease with TOPRIM domain